MELPSEDDLKGLAKAVEDPRLTQAVAVLREFRSACGHIMEVMGELQEAADSAIRSTEKK